MSEQAAVGYVRVSGKGQLDGSGPDRQRETIERHAEANGLRLLRVYQEAYTGAEADRPVFTEMMGDLLSNGCRTIVVESLDRFARDLSVQLQLTALLASRGVRLLNASTGQDVTEAMQADPMMRAMVQIQGVFAELDKRLTVAKLAKARKLKRRRTGRCEGRLPFGARSGEQAILERMRALRVRGMGYGTIAATLEREGLSSRTGRPWSASVVRRILLRRPGVV
jgi:DNA invertase Pin-like site-specific DNA recombinase